MSKEIWNNYFKTEEKESAKFEELKESIKMKELKYFYISSFIFLIVIFTLGIFLNNNINEFKETLYEIYNYKNNNLYISTDGLKEFSSLRDYLIAFENISYDFLNTEQLKEIKNLRIDFFILNTLFLLSLFIHSVFLENLEIGKKIKKGFFKSNYSDLLGNYQLLSKLAFFIFFIIFCFTSWSTFLGTDVVYGLMLIPLITGIFTLYLLINFIIASLSIKEIFTAKNIKELKNDFEKYKSIKDKFFEIQDEIKNNKNHLNFMAEDIATSNYSKKQMGLIKDIFTEIEKEKKEIEGRKKISEEFKNIIDKNFMEEIKEEKIENKKTITNT